MCPNKGLFCYLSRESKLPTIECRNVIAVPSVSKHVTDPKNCVRTNFTAGPRLRTPEINRMPQDGVLFLPEQPPILILLNDILQQRFQT